MGLGLERLGWPGMGGKKKPRQGRRGFGDGVEGLKKGAMRGPGNCSGLTHSSRFRGAAGAAAHRQAGARLRSRSSSGQADRMVVFMLKNSLMDLQRTGLGWR